ncbi:MAG: class I SAM-dependent methyltransferase [Chloroflexi bacterium]|nr:class I SAM-dependent methyltransferase [Chloroflexota bacterium]
MTDPSFADYFAQVQATPGWDAIIQSFARFVALPPNSRVLDVGCGPGSLARHLARDDHTVTGIDADPLMIDRAQYLATEVSDVTFEVGDVRHLRFDDGAFDVALATNVIFLLPDPLAGLRQMTRAVKPGGLVAMLNPSPKMSVAAAEAQANEQKLEGIARVSLVNWARAAEANRRLSVEEAQALFAAAGLVQIETVEKVGPGLALFVKGHKINTGDESK